MARFLQLSTRRTINLDLIALITDDGRKVKVWMIAPAVWALVREMAEVSLNEGEAAVLRRWLQENREPAGS